MPEYLVVDASAWIEFMAGSAKGEQIAKHFKGKTLVMSSFTAMEICVHVLRKGQDDIAVLRATMKQVLTVDVDPEISANAARFYSVARKKKHKLSYGDAVAVMTADYMSAPLIACDNDFKGMKNTIVIE